MRLGWDTVPASYVDWVQSAGAVVVPLASGVRWNTTDPDHWVVEPDAAATGWDRARVAALFDNLNGLLLPGGDPWPQVSSPVLRQLLDLAGAANYRGNYFPVWGTCAGFETLVALGAGECQATVADGNTPPHFTNQNR